MRVGRVEYWLKYNKKCWVRDQLRWMDPIHLGRKPKPDKYKDSRKGK